MPTLTLLGTTDLHAHIHPWDYFQGREAPLGLARVASLIRQERAKDPAATLLLDAGDTIQGTPLGAYYGLQDPLAPHPMALAMNALGYDAMALGNHDFNYGQAVLGRFIERCRFPVLAANICRLDGSPAFVPSVLKSVAGIRVGLLGLTTPRIDVWEDPDHVVGLRFDPLIETAQRWVPCLRAQGAEVVVLLLHSGPDRLPLSYEAAAWQSDRQGWRLTYSLVGENEAIQLAEQVPGIDVILAGHTHKPIPALIVNGVVISQPNCYGSHLSRITLDLDRIRDRWQVIGQQSDLLSAQTSQPDPEILALTHPHHQATLTYIEQPIGTAVGPFPGGIRARLSPSPLAELINQAQLEAAEAAGWPADLSATAIFSDAGQISPGPIALRDVYGVTVYDNQLCVIEITGDILRQALERTAEYFRQLDALPTSPAQALTPFAFDYNWDLYSGIAYTIDITRPIGQRLTRLRLHGADIDLSQRLRLAVNHYRAGGGGGFTMFQAGRVLWKSALSVRELLVGYIRRHPNLDPARFLASDFQLIPDLSSLCQAQDPLALPISGG